MTAGCRHGFTLIELLISTALAMLLASVATGAFLQVRQTVARAETRLATHRSAQAVYATLQRSLGALQQSCAMVIATTADDGSGTGRIELVFMRAKEQYEDYGSEASLRSDLTWEQWLWEDDSGRLTVATNSPARAQYHSPGVTPPGGVTLPKITVHNLAQPRRFLDPSDPFGTGSNGLDGNIVFPSSTDPRVSLAGSGDVGDYTDLQRNRRPVMERISALAVQLVHHDGSVSTYDDSATRTDVIQGVWPDGRLSPTLVDAPAYAGSELAQRPRLLRLRFTATDPQTDAEITFSFSFALPGLAGAP